MWQLLIWQRIMDDENLRGRKLYSEQQYSSMDRLHPPVDQKSLLLADESDRSARCGLNAPLLHTKYGIDQRL